MLYFKLKRSWTENELIVYDIGAVESKMKMWDVPFKREWLKRGESTTFKDATGARSVAVEPCYTKPR